MGWNLKMTIILCPELLVPPSNCLEKEDQMMFEVIHSSKDQECCLEKIQAIGKMQLRNNQHQVLYLSILVPVL